MPPILILELELLMEMKFKTSESGWTNTLERGVNINKWWKATWTKTIRWSWWIAGRKTEQRTRRLMLETRTIKNPITHNCIVNGWFGARQRAVEGPHQCHCLSLLPKLHCTNIYIGVPLAYKKPCIYEKSYHHFYSYKLYAIQLAKNLQLYSTYKHTSE